jgi:WD40 repeat protein
MDNTLAVPDPWYRLGLKRPWQNLTGSMPLSAFIIIVGIGTTIPIRASDRCLSSLAPSKAERTLIINELVALVLSHEQSNRQSSPWYPISNNSLLRDKQHELSLKIGRKAANELLKEVQDQVMKHLLKTNDIDQTKEQRPANTSLNHPVKVVILNPQLVREFVKQIDGALSDATLTQDESMILTVPEDRNVRTAKLVDTETGNLLHTFEGHTSGLTSAVFSPNEMQVLTASWDHTAKLWNSQNGEIIRTFKGHGMPINSAVFSPDGLQVLTGSSDGTARLWDTGTGELLRTFYGSEEAPQKGVVLSELSAIKIQSALFSPNGLHILAVLGNGTAKLWDAQTGELLQIFKGHDGAINKAVFSPDGLQVLTASAVKTVKLWDALTGKWVRTFESHKSWVNSAGFSPDGKQILTTSNDRTVKLWDAETGNVLYSWERKEAEVNSASFSPNGKSVLIAYDDNTTTLWSLNVEIALDGTTQGSDPR